ncbi:hypothetical protein F528_1481 [Neisseria meningitidis 992008]|nr:hypothetical protein F528_1481 [Neisseria meningitidis 992008]
MQSMILPRRRRQIPFSYRLKFIIEINVLFESAYQTASFVG